MDADGSGHGFDPHYSTINRIGRNQRAKEPRKNREASLTQQIPCYFKIESLGQICASKKGDSLPPVLVAGDEVSVTYDIHIYGRSVPHHLTGNVPCTLIPCPFVLFNRQKGVQFHRGEKYG